MNKAIILKLIGLILLIETALLILPVIVSLIYNDGDWTSFLYTLIISGVAGGCLFGFIKPSRMNINARDGFIITAGAWTVLSFAGAAPFSFSGAMPTYLDSLFEAVSGFTTTGITILPDVTVLSQSMLFWRSLTQWIGGMGVLVFMLALVPMLGGSSVQIFKAESPGPIKEKLTPKMSQGAKWLYVMYIGVTLAEIIALCISGMDFFHSAVIALPTVATGGFAYLNTSLATFTVAQQIIVEIFMLIASINFGLMFLVITGKAKQARKNEELRVYLITVLVAAALIFVNLMQYNQMGSAGQNIHHSIFGTISSITSTGYSSADMNVWPWFSKGLLILLMFIGGCAGSTAGGIKISRFIILFKCVAQSLKSLYKPRHVVEVRYNGKKISPEVVKNTTLYFFLIVAITIASMIIVSQDPMMDFDTSLASVATTINNNGIDFHGVSVGGYITFQWYTKIVYIFDMLVGRLEIFPVLILIISAFSPFGKIVKKARLMKKASGD